MSCVLGFDVGSRLIGVAVGHRLTGSARALGVLANHQGKPDWAPLDRWRADWQPESAVVGLPLTLDGAEQAASAAARDFAAQLSGRYDLTVNFVDERYSSREAAQRFADARARGQRRRSDAAQIDAEAAAVILERWLLEHPFIPTSY